MRISTTSSSLFLATLAMSSSSAALAAPTEPEATEHSLIPSSSSMRSIVVSGRSDVANMGVFSPYVEGHLAPSVELRHDRRQLDTVIDMLGDIPMMGPILAGLMDTVLDALGLQRQGATGTQSVQSVTPEQVRKVAQAISNAHAQIQSIPVQTLAARDGIVQWDADSASAPPASDATPAPVAAKPPVPSAKPPVPSGLPIPSNLPIASGKPPAPSPPALPVNPPNSPVDAQPSAPASAPVLGGKFPAPPAPRDAPPMFVGVKAVDGKVEVAVGSDAATTFTENSWMPATAASNSSATAAQSEPALDYASPSTVFSSGSDAHATSSA